MGQLWAIQLVRGRQLGDGHPAFRWAPDLVRCPIIPPRSQLAHVEVALLCQVVPQSTPGTLLRLLVLREDPLDHFHQSALSVQREGAVELRVTQAARHFHGVEVCLSQSLEKVSYRPLGYSISAQPTLRTPGFEGLGV